MASLHQDPSQYFLLHGVRGMNKHACVKGCTQRAMILCDGTIDSHRKQYSKSIAQWEHLSFAIFAIFDLKRQLKLLEVACAQFLTFLLFNLRWAFFPIKISRKAQWEHLISMYFDDFLTICFIFQSKSTFSMIK